jgi:hypothetical protein
MLFQEWQNQLARQGISDLNLQILISDALSLPHKLLGFSSLTQKYEFQVLKSF